MHVHVRAQAQAHAHAQARVRAEVQVQNQVGLQGEDVEEVEVGLPRSFPTIACVESSDSTISIQ